MKQKKPTFSIKYGKHTFEYENGAELYIFHTGIHNEFDKRYGIKGLLAYTAFVYDCYIEDSNPTPLGRLGDYIAHHWKKAQKQGIYETLDKFYLQEIY